MTAALLGRAAAALLAAAAAPTPTVQVSPARARPGDAFLVVVRRAPAPPEATAAGRRLEFFAVRGGWAAFGGLPIETAAGHVPVAVGGAEAARLEVDGAEFPHRELAVGDEYVAPRPPELQRRLDEDRAAFARAFARPPSPPLFTGPFALPRRDRITAGYGEARTLNGSRSSQHYGLDLAGKVGAPVGAANAGEVALVRDCWASGRSVVLFHGAGLFTTYFHLSRIDVREGQRVARGQRIGAVGKSGRVTGPHLHWGVRVGDLYVDPRSVMALPVRKLGLPPPRGGARRRAG